MPRPKRWLEEPIVDGVGTIRLSHWKYFHDLLVEERLASPDLVFRGQRKAKWELIPSLDRTLAEKTPAEAALIRAQHLRRFQYATAGRRGLAPPELTEDHWWALGQHHGLKTPLLDWTHSPYVAAYFAFSEPDRNIFRALENRAIWALSSSACDRVREQLSAANMPEEQLRLSLVRILRPRSDENQRLVSQAGLFTISPPGKAVEDWVKSHFRGATDPVLVKIEISGLYRTECITNLNRMNINHLTLLPDLLGASVHCNMHIDGQTY